MMYLSFGFLLCVFSIILGSQGHFLVPRNQQPGGGGNQTGEPNIPGGQVLQVNQTITGFLQSNQSFGVLNKLLNDTTLSAALNSTNVTLFAPNDQAFNNLPSWIVQHVQNATNSSSLPALQALLLYHIHPGADFKPKNFTSPQNETVNTTEWSATWRSYDYLTSIQLGNGDGNQTENQTQTSHNASTLSTAMKPLNLTIYTNNQSEWYVNDAQVVSVINATNGYIFELSKVVTPLYYLNTSIYNLTQAPPQLGSNYTFPQPSNSTPEFNLTTSEWKAYTKEMRKDWMRYEAQAHGLSLAYSFALY